MAENEKKAAEVVEKSKEKDTAPQKTKEPLWGRIKIGFRNLKSEFRKIVWYPRDSTVNSTLLVLVSMIILSAFVGLLDYVFSVGIVGLGRLM